MAQIKEIRIEVEEDHIMVVLPWLMDDWVTPWQEAYIFGDALEKAAEEIPTKGEILPIAAEIQAAAIRLTTDKDKFVVMVFDHTDRIKLSYEAARMVGRAIKLKAQDLMYLARGVFMNYNAKGRQGRVTPFWDESRFPKTFGGLGKKP